MPAVDGYVERAQAEPGRGSALRFLFQRAAEEGQNGPVLFAGRLFFDLDEGGEVEDGHVGAGADPDLLCVGEQIAVATVVSDYTQKVKRAVACQEQLMAR